MPFHGCKNPKGIKNVLELKFVRKSDSMSIIGDGQLWAKIQHFFEKEPSATTATSWAIQSMVMRWKNK